MAIRCGPTWVLRKAIQEKHPGLVSILGTPVGVRLMFTESRVLLGVLESLMAADIVALPIHDGLMMAQSNQEIAKGLSGNKCMILSRSG